MLNNQRIAKKRTRSNLVNYAIESGISLGVYLTGVVLLLLRMILGIVRVLLLKRKGEKGEFKGCTLVRIPDKMAPFSFFRTIYLNSDHLNDSDRKYIIDHELIHIRQLHS